MCTPTPPSPRSQNQNKILLNPSSSQESPASSTAKIIVNSFHASSLLNSNSNANTNKAIAINNNTSTNGDLSARLLSHGNSNNTNSSASTLGGVRITTTSKQKTNKLLGPPKEDVDSVEKLKLILARPPPKAERRIADAR